MSMSHAIRIFKEEKEFDVLIKITAPLIQHIKEGKFINGTMITFMDELYMELVKRGEINRLQDIDEKEKRRYWKRAKETGETDVKKLSIHCRAFYVADMV